MSILDNFEVFEVSRTFSVAEVHVLKNKISFNIPAASELGYPAFVRVFISRDKTQIALQPCERTTPNAMKFFTPEIASRKRPRTISVGNKALSVLIKSGMGWDMAQVIHAPGIRFSEDNVIIFDLKQAYEKGNKPNGETSLCVIPQLAHPFYNVPAQYFQDRPGEVIEAQGEILPA